MKRKNIFWTIAIVAVMASVLVGCTGKKDTNGSVTSGGSSGNSNSSDQQLITVDTKTAEGSEARDQYFADTVREEFIFGRNGTLTGYKRIYTFVHAADKEKALERITAADFKATIEGNTLVVDGNGYYLGFPYDDSNFTEIKERLDGRDAQYTVK